MNPGAPKPTTVRFLAAAFCASALTVSLFIPVTAAEVNSVTRRHTVGVISGGEGAVEITIDLTPEPGEEIRSLYLLTSKTKQSASSDQIRNGDPVGKNYFHFGSPEGWAYEVTRSTPVDSRGEQEWYVGWTSISGEPLPETFTQFILFYTGDRNVELRRGTLVLNSDFDGDPKTGVIATYDCHVPSGR